MRLLIVVALLATSALVEGNLLKFGSGFMADIMKLVERVTNMKQGKHMCNKYECPTYEVKMKKPLYELRCYNKAYWVSVPGSDSIPKQSTMFGSGGKMFGQLFAYISGGNKIGVKINMTAPVLTQLTDEGESMQAKMSFYIPRKFQSKPPSPTNKNVLVESKAFCAYVHRFGGYPLFYSQLQSHVDMLAKALEKDGLQSSYVKGTYYFAGYNKPTTIFGRRNEVMLLKKSSES